MERGKVITQRDAALLMDGPELAQMCSTSTLTATAGKCAYRTPGPAVRVSAFAPSVAVPPVVIGVEDDEMGKVQHAHQSG
jgi:hypothetical protein